MKTDATVTQVERRLFDYRPYWAECFGVAPFLPTSREEMDQLGWDSCDVIIVTGDAYVDHVSFGMAVMCARMEPLLPRAALLTAFHTCSKAV